MNKIIRSACIVCCTVLAMSTLSACATISVNIRTKANTDAATDTGDTNATGDTAQAKDADTAQTTDAGSAQEKTDDMTRGLPDISDEDLSYEDLYLEEMVTLYDAGDADQFAFVFINEDDIPELIAVSSEGSWDKDQIFIYTIGNDNELVQLITDVAPGVDGKYIAFADEENIIEVSGAAFGERHEYYEIKDGKLNPILTLESYNDPENDGEDEDARLYFIDDKAADEKSYMEAEKKMVSDYDKMVRIDVENMTEVALTYNDDGYREIEEKDVIPYLTPEDMELE